MAEVVSFKKRRGVELFLVLIALAIGCGGYLISSLNLTGKLPEGWELTVGLWAVLGLAAHVCVRIWIPYADPIILPCVLALNGIGLSMIYRIDRAGEVIRSDSTTQFIWTALGVAGFVAVVALLKDHRPLQRFTYLTFLAGIILLFLPLVPGLGVELNGARIWIRLGSFSFQPAEVAKIALAVAFASYLADTRAVLSQAGARIAGVDLPRPRDLGPILVAWLICIGIMVFQKDLGTALLFFGLFVILLYVATEKASWPILGTTMFVAAAYVSYQLFSHVQVRFSSWLDPFSNFDQNYQIIQGQFGMAWAGVFGRGWGLGRPSLTPLAKSDFIFAAVGEETGLLGMMAILLLYMIIVARGLRTALTAREPFGKLLAAGLAFVFCLQVFAIVGGVTRLLPLTGLTTPFMSQGGSSLIANWAMVGLMLVISHQVRKPFNEPTMIAVVEDLADDHTQVIQARGDAS